MFTCNAGDDELKTGLMEEGNCFYLSQGFSGVED